LGESVSARRLGIRLGFQIIFPLYTLLLTIVKHKFKIEIMYLMYYLGDEKQLDRMMDAR